MKIRIAFGSEPIGLLHEPFSQDAHPGNASIDIVRLGEEIDEHFQDVDRASTEPGTCHVRESAFRCLITVFVLSNCAFLLKFAGDSFKQVFISIIFVIQVMSSLEKWHLLLICIMSFRGFFDAFQDAGNRYKS